MYAKRLIEGFDVALKRDLRGYFFAARKVRIPGRVNPEVGETFGGSDGGLIRGTGEFVHLGDPGRL